MMTRYKSGRVAAPNNFAGPVASHTRDAGTNHIEIEPRRTNRGGEVAVTYFRRGRGRPRKKPKLMDVTHQLPVVVPYPEVIFSKIVTEAMAKVPRRRGVKPYLPKELNPPNANFVWRLYEERMTLLLTGMSPPSFFSMPLPMFIAPSNISDISFPAVVHFIGHRHLQWAPKEKRIWEDEEDYMVRYKLRVAELAGEELLKWMPSEFGKKVIDRIVDVEERKLARKWQLAVVSVLTDIVMEYVQYGDAKKLDDFDQEYEAFVKMHGEYLNNKAPDTQAKSWVREETGSWLDIVSSTEEAFAI